MTIRVTLSGKIVKNGETSPVLTNMNWPDGIPIRNGDSVRFAFQGSTIEGNIVNVTVDLGDQTNQRLGAPPMINLENLREIT